MALKRLGVLAVYMSGSRLEELSFYKRLISEGRKLGLQVEIFTPNDAVYKESVRSLKYNATLRKWVRSRTTFPSLIYDRCRYHGAATYRQLKTFRSEYNKLNYLSKPLANKWKMHQVLSEDKGISMHVPATYRYSNSEELIRFLKKYRLIYLKPKNGTGGRGIIRIEQMSDNYYLIQGRNKQRMIMTPQKTSEKQLRMKLNELKLNEDYVIQQGINLTLRNGRVHDYRLLIQKNGHGEWEITGCAICAVCQCCRHGEHAW